MKKQANSEDPIPGPSKRMRMERSSKENIEKTFEDSMIPIKDHFAKPGVVPVQILPVFPDFDLFKYPFAEVTFDSDPAPVGKLIPEQLEEMSQAMLRGVMDEDGEQFVVYFLPTEETLSKRKRDQSINQEYQKDDTYEYRMTQEYNWSCQVPQATGHQPNHFFVIRNNGVFYNEIETKVRLSQRKRRGPDQQPDAKLCVKHIPSHSDWKLQKRGKN